MKHHSLGASSASYAYYALKHRLNRNDSILSDTTRSRDAYFVAFFVSEQRLSDGGLIGDQASFRVSFESLYDLEISCRTIIGLNVHLHTDTNCRRAVFSVMHIGCHNL